MNLKELAGLHFQDMSCNSYPGRIIILGRTPDGSCIQIYSIMGRSDPSRNRIFEKMPDRHGWIETSFVDESKVSGDPNLLIYHAMAEADGYYIVSNGRQTDDLIQIEGIGVLETGDWKYEPDTSHTPRISGIYSPGDVLDMRLVILRKSPFGDACDLMDYAFSGVAPGFGFFISTYEGDGDPLPSFKGEPQVMPIESNDPAEIAATYWAALDADNRVALAVKVIPSNGPSKIEIINRYTVG